MAKSGRRKFRLRGFVFRDQPSADIIIDMHDDDELMIQHLLARDHVPQVVHLASLFGAALDWNQKSDVRNGVYCTNVHAMLDNMVTQGHQPYLDLWYSTRQHIAVQNIRNFQPPYRITIMFEEQAAD